MIDFNIKDYTRGILPNGRYTLQIKKTELKPSKNGDNMVQLQLKVISAFRTGQTVLKNFNIYNPSEVAQKLAREDLAELCHAMGIQELKNIHELHDLIVDADIIESQYNDKPTNEIKKFMEPVNKSAAMDALAKDAPFNDDIAF